MSESPEDTKRVGGDAMKQPKFVYRKIVIGDCTTYEIGECFNPRRYDSWCDRRVCEGFWGDEAQCKWTVRAMNKASK